MHEVVKQAAKTLIELSLEKARKTAPGAQLFILLDPSRDSNLTTVIQGLAQRAECLYIGSARDEFEDDAPWLAQCEDLDGLSDFLIDEGMGQRWCVFAISDGSYDELFRHFRKLVKIRQAKGDLLFFRFYDPEVLGSIIPFLTSEQRTYLFGPVRSFLMEIAAGSDLGFGRMEAPDSGSIPVSFMLPSPDGANKIISEESIIRGPAELLASHMVFDLVGAVTKPVLTLTQAQLEAPVLFNRPKLVASTIEYLEEDFGEAMKVMPPGMLAQNINHGIDLAMSYRIFDVSHIHLFVDLMMRIAPGWHRQPSLASVLTRADLPPEERFDIMLNPRYDDAWEDARRFSDPEEWIERKQRENNNVH
ncbi:DUF4123 domain-containing protein [Sinorhizobium americanum]|uniref:Uncharacterized protein DUF4123 n=1 Tax=Sinorhizobium americanum TaxID=194963 RepID=A0A4R2C129_9HYPH|nr:DUF4123 domain-containing protein [Sinorhizobium americanum]TCN33796.1 uncharacterized protein DUF4123 [Sinorhizobium americanum]